MIIITRKYTEKVDGIASREERRTEYKVFHDSDVTGVQRYLNENKGQIEFTKV